MVLKGQAVGGVELMKVGSSCQDPIEFQTMELNKRSLQVLVAQRTVVVTFSKHQS